MRKFQILFTSLIVFLLVGFLACEKEQTNVSETSVTKSSKPTHQDVLNFINLMENIKNGKGLKSSKFISVDSTIWYIEAGANCMMSDASLKEEKLTRFTSLIEVPICKEGVLIEDVQDAFGKTLDSINKHIKQVDFDAKKLFLADVYLEKNSGDKILLGIESSVTSSYLGWMQINHDWYWGGLLGTCDGLNIGAGQRDAAIVIEQHLNQAIYMPPAGCYWTGIEYHEMVGEADGLFEFFGPYYSTPDPCLSISEIQYYKNYVAGEAISNTPPDKQIVYKYFEAEILICMEEKLGKHISQTKYGQIMCNIMPMPY